MGRWLGVKDDLRDEGKGVRPLKVPVPQDPGPGRGGEGHNVMPWHLSPPVLEVKGR